jgi:hypothetical protein
MPTLLTIFGLRFFFYTREHEPIHVHVEHADGVAKYNLQDDCVELVENKGLKPASLRLAESILEENRVNFINEWNKTFNM